MDRAGVDRQDVPEPERLALRGKEVVHDDIGAPDERARERRAFGGSQIEAERALVAVEGLVELAVAGAEEVLDETRVPADAAGQSTRSNPARAAPSAAAITPATGRTAPSSPSSPIHACFSSLAVGTCSDAASSVRAIARSKPVPSFRRAAGARLTVITIWGHGRRAE